MADISRWAAPDRAFAESSAAPHEVGAALRVAPIHLANLPNQTVGAMSATLVDDYAPGHYTGELTPSPPHADMNPKKAVVISWKGRSTRFVFSHEASYCPILELPSGAGLCTQFFEGNLGDAELFNSLGRKEKNSFVDILDAGPERAWVRWTYFAVQKDDDRQPRLRGTEDYFAYPNGLILRRLSYESLLPDAVVGYSTQPVELFGVLPQKARYPDFFVRDGKHGDSNVLTVLGLFDGLRYDVLWGAGGEVRRNGDDATLAAITASAGCALVLPFREQLLFAVIGTASGFSPTYNQLVDHCTRGAAGGAGWGQGIWDHWPIGWLNSQGHDWKPGSDYAYHFGSIGQFFVPEGKRLKSFWRDYSEYCKDMEFNRWTANRVYHVLIGAATHTDEIIRIGRAWLKLGADCTKPERVREIR